jgi:hypothetical protein
MVDVTLSGLEPIEDPFPRAAQSLRAVDRHATDRTPRPAPFSGVSGVVRPVVLRRDSR